MIKQCHDLQGKDFEAKVENEINIAPDYIQDKQQRGSTMIVRYGFDQGAHGHTTTIGKYLRKLSRGWRSTKGLHNAQILDFCSTNNRNQHCIQEFVAPNLDQGRLWNSRLHTHSRTRILPLRRKKLPHCMQPGMPPDDDDAFKKTPKSIRTRLFNQIE